MEKIIIICRVSGLDLIKVLILVEKLSYRVGKKLTQDHTSESSIKILTFQHSVSFSLEKHFYFLLLLWMLESGGKETYW